MIQRALEVARRFLRGIATNWIGKTGVVLTTSAFLLFSLGELLRLSGALTNAYVGLISYLSLPLVFVVGLLLIPVGWWRFRTAAKRTRRELLAEQFTDDLVQARPIGSRLFAILGALTLGNMIFLGAGSARMLHFMDQPVFCGTACHGVMHPEWITYQQSPHANVACVDCHVGEGAEALLDCKLNGAWQMVSVTFNLLERPIPTPVHNLRPARETCEKCHWSEKFYGDRIKTLARFGNDEDSPPRYDYAVAQGRIRDRPPAGCDSLARRGGRRSPVPTRGRATGYRPMGRGPPSGRGLAPIHQQQAPRAGVQRGRPPGNPLRPIHGLRGLPQPGDTHLRRPLPGRGQGDRTRPHRSRDSLRPQAGGGSPDGGMPREYPPGVPAAEAIARTSGASMRARCPWSCTSTPGRSTRPWKRCSVFMLATSTPE